MHSSGENGDAVLTASAALGQPGLGAGYHAQGTWRWPSVTVRAKLHAKAAPVSWDLRTPTVQAGVPLW